MTPLPPSLPARGAPSPIFFGWAVVGGAFVSHLLNYGVLTVAFGVFFPFMADALGLARGTLASIAALARVLGAAVGPALGAFVDRHGPRPAMAFGVVSVAAGAVVLAAAHGVWHVVIGYGVVMALGSVALGELTADATVARWFIRRRSRALAVATMGLSAAGVLIPVPVALVIAHAGWRTAWLVVAAGTLLVGGAATVVMRRRPEDHGLRPDGDPPVVTGAAGAAWERERSFAAREAARTPAFWLLVVSTNLAGLALFGINLHLFAFLTDAGFAAGTAAWLLTYLYTLHTVAKPLWALVAERVHVRVCIAVCYFGGAAAVGVLLVSRSLTALLLFATVYGLTRGAQSFVTSLAWADYFGREAQGAIRGLASPFRFLAQAAGPVVGGVLYDITGSYAVAFVVFALAFATGGVIALAARPPVRLA